MPLPKKHTFVFYPGDKFTQIIDVVDEDSVAVDLTGEDISFVVSADDTVLYTLTVGDGLGIVAEDGRIIVTLTSTQTEALRGLSNRSYVLRFDTSEETVILGSLGAYT